MKFQERYRRHGRFRVSEKRLESLKQTLSNAEQEASIIIHFDNSEFDLKWRELLEEGFAGVGKTKSLMVIRYRDGHYAAKVIFAKHKSYVVERASCAIEVTGDDRRQVISIMAQLKSDVDETRQPDRRPPYNVVYWLLNILLILLGFYAFADILSLMETSPRQLIYLLLITVCAAIISTAGALGLVWIQDLFMPALLLNIPNLTEGELRRSTQRKALAWIASTILVPIVLFVASFLLL